MQLCQPVHDNPGVASLEILGLRKSCRAQVDDCINKFHWVNKLNNGLAQLQKEGKPLPSTPEEITRVLGTPFLRFACSCFRVDKELMLELTAVGETAMTTVLTKVCFKCNGIDIDSLLVDLVGFAGIAQPGTADEGAIFLIVVLCGCLGLGPNGRGKLVIPAKMLGTALTSI